MPEYLHKIVCAPGIALYADADLDRIEDLIAKLDSHQIIYVENDRERARRDDVIDHFNSTVIDSYLYVRTESAS